METGNSASVRAGTRKIWIIVAAFVIVAVLAVAAILLLLGRQGDTKPTVAEGAAITEICGVDYRDFTDITPGVMTKERSAKFPAVDKVSVNGDLYAFIVKPIAYNGPVVLAVVIDGSNGKSIGMRIVEHAETPHYVRDMDNTWFTNRFAGKSVLEYLGIVRLAARSDNEIVAITGATVSTEGIVNGVNAAFGVFQEYVLGTTAAEVPYMVRFEPGVGDGPVETGSLVIRAYGLVLAEIGLDEIRALPSVRRVMSIHSTAGVTSHSFRGTLLSNVLNLADPGLVGEYDWALAVGVDDFMSGIGMNEIMAENSVFVMYEDNDEPLLKKNGEPGGIRIVVLDDVFGQRFTQFMIEIVLSEELR